MRALILFVGLPISCAELADFPTHAAAIRDGYDDDVDVAVVGIVDTASNATCTGALIAPRLVLTAQHCVADLLGPFDCATTLFGPAHAPGRFLVTTRPMYSLDVSDYHAVAEVVVPPG